MAIGNVRFLPDNNNFVIHTDITDKKELAYKYDGKTYLSYPISRNNGVLKLDNTNYDGHLLISKRSIRNNGLKKAKKDEIQKLADNYIFDYIISINNFNNTLKCLKTELH